MRVLSARLRLVIKCADSGESFCARRSGCKASADRATSPFRDAGISKLCKPIRSAYERYSDLAPAITNDDSSPGQREIGSIVGVATGCAWPYRPPMCRELFSTHFANESGTMPVPIFRLSAASMRLFTWVCAGPRYVSFCREESRIILDDPLLAGLFFHIKWCVAIVV